MSKYGVFSDPYFPVFSPNDVCVFDHNLVDQKKLRIWTLFTQCYPHITFHILSLSLCNLFFLTWERVLTGEHEKKCLESLLINAFSSNLNSIVLRVFFPNHGGIYRFERKFNRYSQER